MIADHLVTIALVALVPIWSIWSWKRLERGLAAGREDARLAAYSETMLLEWGLVIVVLISFLAAGRSPEDLGLLAPLTGSFAITTGIVVIVSILLLAQTRAIRRREGEDGGALRRQMASVEKMMPHTAGERSVFLALSLTAGFCEELLYRGFLIGYFASMTGPVAAVAIAAVVFGVTHAYQGGLGIVKTGLVGAAMGGIYVVSGSIWPAIILHAVLDVQGGLVGYEVFGRPVAAPEKTS
jgi:uncharacterized protein